MHDESSQRGELPLRAIADVFSRHGVEFIVIGGQAEALMGSPRVTYDVDLCYRRSDENIRRLADALKELDISLRTPRENVPFVADARAIKNGLNFTLNTRVGALDLLGEVEPIGDFDCLYRDREVYEIWGRQLSTISLEDLIRVKQHIKRVKDGESLFQLLAIRQVRQEDAIRKSTEPPSQ